MSEFTRRLAVVVISIAVVLPWAVTVAAAADESPSIVIAQADETVDIEPVGAEADPEEDGTDRPWWRLALIVPLAALVGAGAVQPEV